MAYYTISFSELIVPFEICSVNICAVSSFLWCKLEILAIKKFKEQSALSSVLAACRVMVITVFMYLRLFYFLIYYCIYSKWTLPFENKPTALPWFTESIFSFLVYYSKWYQPFGTEPTIFIWFKESIFSLVYFFIMISSIRNWTCNFALVQGIQLFFSFLSNWLS